MSRLITTSQASQLAGYAREHIARLAEAGKIKACRFGRAWMIDEQDLLHYVQQAECSHNGRYGPRSEGPGG